jgi:putative ABC transport system permease protein
LAGVILGVAVFLAMHTANQSLFSAFNKTVDQIAGATQLQVSAGEFGFEETVLETVQSVPEVGVAVPVIESAVETRAAGQGSILILGIDMTGDRSLRTYDLIDADATIIDDPLIFLAQPDSLLVTREFARRNGIGLNGKVPLLTIEGEKQFTVRGIMSSDGLAQAFDGNLAVMDIYAAQHFLGRGRRFDRLDIRAKDGVSVERCQAAVRQALGPGFEVDTPSARGKHFEALLQSYSTTTSISSLFALIVGMFIIYNSFAIAVTHRRSEIGILRALGATRGQIQRLFLVESLVAGLIGSVLGAALGLVGAWTVARSVSGILEQAGGVAQRVTELAINPALIATGMIVGIGTSMLAAWIPARDAARVDPVKALQKGTYQILSVGENRRRRRIALVFVTFSIICIVFSNSAVVFYSGYIVMMFAALLLAPTLTLLLSKAGRPILKQAFPAEGTLAADSLVQAPRRTSATVSALMLSLAMVVGFRGVAQSFYTAFDDWMGSAMNPDFFVAPSANLTRLAITFPGEFGHILENVAGVNHVQLVRNARVVVRDIPAMVVVQETDKVAKTIRRVPVEGALDQMNRLTAEGKGTIVSESFAFFRKMKMGDVVDLPTPSGALRLPIVGIVQDYSDMQGSLFIDRSVYLQWWKDDTANNARVYIKEDQNPAEVRQRILNALAGRQRLFVLTNREVREWITTILDQWFAMTYNQIAVAILVAILGIVNTLTVSITDRRRELGVMQAVGGFRRQVRRTIWIEAISIGVIGLILGIGLGSVNLYYTLGMVKRDLAGIHLQYVFPIGFALLMIPTIVVAAFVAALGPGESAVRSPLIEALEYE